MKLNRIALAALAGITALGGLAAAPAFARDSLTIQYRDGSHRDRDYDRYRDNHGYSGYRDHRDWRASDRGYNDRYRDRCWTDWQWDGWRHERVPVRVCR